MAESGLACPEVLDSLQDYVDGELPPPFALSVARHLERCDACRAAVRSPEALVALLRRADTGSAPPGLRRRIIERLLQEDQRGAG